MLDFISENPLAHGLVRIGDEAIAKENDRLLRDYFANDFVFHGPDGDLGFEDLRSYFAALRTAFTNFRIEREQIVVDGNHAGARNRFSGRFDNVFTHSPVGSLEPTGEHVEWVVINTFRFNDTGQLAEEWAQTDSRTLVSKLKGAES
jgi:predicted ester cyclase